MSDADGIVVVAPDDALPDVLTRLGEAAKAGSEIRLVVPIDSSLLLTAVEFRALKDASESQRWPVVLRTADPLRLQLAERIGIRAEALPRGARPPARVPVAVAVPTTAVPDSLSRGADDWPGEPPPVEVAPRPDPAAAWPDRTPAVALDLEETPDAPPDDSEVATASRPPRHWLPVAVALVALVAAAYFGIRYLVPSAVIRIVPKTAAASQALVFDVTEDGQPLDGTALFALTPESRQVEMVWEGSLPVTGVRLEPDGIAAGPIELRNPSPEPVNVAAGTTVSTETGVTFAFTDDVTVPGSDAASGRPGAATANVRAVEPGSGGNVGNGELGGRLPNGVYYSNRSQPAEGGTDKEFPVVSEEDVAALSAKAKEAAPELAAAALGKSDPDLTVLASTVKVAAQHDEFDTPVGGDAETVSVRSTLTLELLTYDGATAREHYEPLLQARLRDTAPAGYAIDPRSVQFDGPVEQTTEGGAVRLQVTANAEAVAVLDDAERRRLAAALAGLDEQHAAAILETAPQIESFRVELQPVWLSQQFPANPERIEFEVGG